MKKEKKSIDRDDITTMFVMIAKRINSISSDKKEFNQMIEHIIDFIISGNFSFGQLDIMLSMAEKAKQGIRKDVIISYYIDRVIPCVEKVKSVENTEDRQIYEKVLLTQMQKFGRYVEPTDFKPSVLGEILDQMTPTKEMNFQHVSSEVLDRARNKLNENYKNLDTEVQL